ncbi:hypothetical protein [Nitrosomonas supralitoralis]|uniref:Uncharacterized protein n=1 Tax=Nitrosomonas supralitoralis TaxID=2116706 RepID=A0A2P7NZR8_9PROT|nr:hypothetical protein [Nitrosomonas supralitoralis]PSJ18961.1 hypothetical protein C7H79_00575 [Nitrosomonas supralitoralis]
MSAQILTIHLNLKEGNLLLEALAECPFKSVFELIGSLNQQANDLFVTGIAANERQPFVFTESELSLAMQALSKMPYHRVNQLLTEINQQIHHQLNLHLAVVPTEHVDI